MKKAKNIIQIKDVVKKRERKVIHLQFKSSDLHYYFGSVAQIEKRFTADELGEISHRKIRDYGLTADKPFENDMIIIRRGILETKPKSNTPTLKKKL